MLSEEELVGRVMELEIADLDREDALEIAAVVRQTVLATLERKLDFQAELEGKEQPCRQSCHSRPSTCWSGRLRRRKEAMMSNNLFWERMDGESAQAYEAFALYRDMGITRSIRSVGQQLGKSRALVERWSRKWLWVARTQAFDAEEDRQRWLRMREKRHQTAELHWTVGQLGMKRIVQTIQNMGPEDTLPLRSLAALTSAFAQLQRLALGESTDILDLRGPGQAQEDASWVEGLSLEEKEELAYLSERIEEEMGKMRPGDEESSA